MKQNIELASSGRIGPINMKSLSHVDLMVSYLATKDPCENAKIKRSDVSGRWLKLDGRRALYSWSWLPGPKEKRKKRLLVIAGNLHMCQSARRQNAIQRINQRLKKENFAIEKEGHNGDTKRIPPE